MAYSTVRVHLDDGLAKFVFSGIHLSDWLRHVMGEVNDSGDGATQWNEANITDKKK
jgi:hypothetical protein